jgi:hypothetical protein
MNDVVEHLPLIADIQTTALLYYDEQRIVACYDFCKRRDIDCLPIISDSNSFYLRNDETDKFDKHELSDDRRIDAYTFIFRPDLLERFQRRPVQFVFTHGELTGVIHFSDYNEDLVDTYLFAQFAKYERGLRQLAIGHELKNNNMREYFEEKKAEPNAKDKDIEYYEERLRKYDSTLGRMKKAGEFQFFFMDDLIGLLKSRNIIQLNKSVVELRNIIMHARPPIEMTDVHTDDFIYDIKSFKRFFKYATTLLMDSKCVYNRIAFSEAKP